MTPFRQLILPGDQGSDVKAIKRAMIKMHVKGAGSLIVNNHAGESFVIVLNRILRQHGKKADSKYGKEAHAIIAPHFDLYGVSLYRKAKIRSRKPPATPLGHETARQAAQRLLKFRESGHYHADNYGDLYDLQRTAIGNPVWSHLGRWVYIDHRPLEAVIFLIEKGYKIGTYAICGDHSNDGPHGHAGGLAIDISSINGISIGGGGSHAVTKAVSIDLHSHTPAILRPRQLICDGAGGARYSDIASQCIPYENFYDHNTLLVHRNHIHVGY